MAVVVPSFVFAPMFVFLATFGGIGNDALDFVDSGTYWKRYGIEPTAEALIPIATGEVGGVPDSAKMAKLIEDLGSPDFRTRQTAMSTLVQSGPIARPILERAKESTDPEIATAAAQVLVRLAAKASGQRLHRLMAIRTLGEIKAAAAVPHLEVLRDSKSEFVSEYAARALAEVKGGAFEPHRPDPDTFEEDLAIAYPSAAVVVHARSDPRMGDVAIGKQIGEASALLGALPTFGLKTGKAPDQSELLNRVTGEHLELFQRVGNVRIDSFTAVIPTDYTPTAGGLVVIARGLCDYESSRRFMEEELPKIGPPRGAGGLDVIEVGGVEWIRQMVHGADFYVHFPPGGKLLIFVGGIHSLKYLESVSMRLAGRDKTPADGSAIGLLRRIPDSATAFVAGELPEDAAKELGGVFPDLKAFYGWRDSGEGGRGGFGLALESRDEKWAGELVEKLRVWIGLANGALQHLAKVDSRLTDVADLASSIRVENEGTTIRASASLPKAGGLPVGLLIGFNSLRPLLFP